MFEIGTAHFTVQTGIALFVSASSFYVRVGISMSATPTDPYKAPIGLYVIWAVVAILFFMAYRYAGLVVLALGAMHILFYPSATRAMRTRQAEAERLAAVNAASEAAELNRLRTGPLEPINTSAAVLKLLKDDEECYWEEPAVEWRMQHFVELGSTSNALTTTRVIPEEVEHGTLAITEQRVIFHCESHVHDLPLNAMVSVGYFGDGIRVVARRDRHFLFLTGNDRAAILLKRVISESNSPSSEDIAELPSHCDSCGAPMRVIHHACEYCGARVSRLARPQ